MDVVTKATGSVTPVEDSKSKHGQFDVILSTKALDRDGDELHPDEWKTPLPDKIMFDSDHGMSVATCVGSGKPFINDDGQLQVRGTFASTPHGQAVRTLVNEGHISSVSVAFRELKDKKDAKSQRELLNGAFVAVPANPEAVVLSSKSVKDVEKKSLSDVVSDIIAQQIPDEEKLVLVGKAASNYRLDEMASVNDMFANDPLDSDDVPQRKEYWQGVHDVAIKLGAGCPYSDPQAIPDVLNVSNRSVESDVVLKSSPVESAEESAAADLKSAAADDSADDVALLAERLAISLRSID